MIREQDPITEAELRSRWPQAFNDERLPLKIGINADMGVGDNSESLARWTKHPVYLRNLIERDKRIDLNGEAVEDVTEDAKMIACQELDWLRRNIKRARWGR